MSDSVENSQPLPHCSVSDGLSCHAEAADVVGHCSRVRHVAADSPRPDAFDTTATTSYEISNAETTNVPSSPSDRTAVAGQANAPKYCFIPDAPQPTENFKEYTSKPRPQIFNTAFEALGLIRSLDDWQHDFLRHGSTPGVECTQSKLLQQANDARSLESQWHWSIYLAMKFYLATLPEGLATLKDQSERLAFQIEVMVSLLAMGTVSHYRAVPYIGHNFWNTAKHTGLPELVEKMYDPQWRERVVNVPDSTASTDGHSRDEHRRTSKRKIANISVGLVETAAEDIGEHRSKKQKVDAEESPTSDSNGVEDDDEDAAALALLNMSTMALEASKSPSPNHAGSSNDSSYSPTQSDAGPNIPARPSRRFRDVLKKSKPAGRQSRPRLEAPLPPASSAVPNSSSPVPAVKDTARWGKARQKLEAWLHTNLRGTFSDIVVTEEELEDVRQLANREDNGNPKILHTKDSRRNKNALSEEMNRLRSVWDARAIAAFSLEN